MNDTWTLHGSRRREHHAWEQLHGITRTWTAAWTDVAGFHVDHLPDEPPTTTHLWAWTTDTWLRIRIDGAHWWGALLTRGGDDVGGLWSSQSIKSVPRPTITELRQWNSEDGQAKQYRGDEGVLDQHDMIQLVPLLRNTGVFIGSNDSLHNTT